MGYTQFSDIHNKRTFYRDNSARKIAVMFTLHFLIIINISVLCLSKNQSDILTSTYSKVAIWGAIGNNTSSTEPESGRSYRVQYFTPPRKEVVEWQRTRKPEVMYYYNKQTPSTKVDNDFEYTPAKGEVQERFIPRPYFVYPSDSSIDTIKNNKPSEAFTGYVKQPEPSTLFVDKPVNLKPLPIIYDSPFNPPKPNDSKSLPILYDSPLNSYLPPTSKPKENEPLTPKPGDFPPQSNDEPSKSPSGLYESPYDSYNPPKMKPDDQNTFPGPYQFPPNSSPSGDGSAYLQLQKDKPAQNSSDTLPELYAERDPTGSQNETETKEPQDSYMMPPNFSGYFHHGHFDDDMDLAPPLPEDTEDTEPAMKMPKPEIQHHSQYDLYHHYFQSHHQDSASTTNAPPSPKPAPASPLMMVADLSPPPSDSVFLDHDTSDFHFDHHEIYHEITTTTTAAPATEDKRLNDKGHYSYYYLGRKLWYIPLYFSIYFIVYITILILKSIARHKVQFAQNNFQSRSLQPDIDEISYNVHRSLREAKLKYM